MWGLAFPVIGSITSYYKGYGHTNPFIGIFVGIQDTNKRGTNMAGKLTDSKLRALKADGTIQKIADGGGLYIHVSPTGGKLWRVAYRFEGKQKTLSLGSYPAVSLTEARERLREAKERLAKGIDPGALKKAMKAASKAEAANAYEVVAREWMAKKAATWTPEHGAKVLSRQANNIFPLLGGLPIAKITAPELLDALRRIEERGANDTAHRVLQECGAIFCYAIVTGRAERNPAADLKGALTPYKTSHFACITDPAKVGQLLRDIEIYPGEIVVRAALKVIPYIFTRQKELRRMEWTEVNLDAAEWRIPADKMKMDVPHIVPLSRQVVDILRDLEQFTGGGKYVFPSTRAKSGILSDVTLLAAIRRLGYPKEEMTVHGFRGMASTIMNEMGVKADWIERQLSHGDRNGVRAAYNHAEYLQARRRMMQAWADYLDALKAGADPAEAAERFRMTGK